MFKQTAIILLFLVGAVVCNLSEESEQRRAEVEGEAPVNRQQVEGQFGRHTGNARTHLKNLVDGAKEHGTRAYQAARPALNDLREDAKNTINTIRTSKTVQNAGRSIEPHLVAIKGRVAPVVNQGKERVSNFISRQRQKHQDRKSQRQQVAESEPEEEAYEQSAESAREHV